MELIKDGDKILAIVYRDDDWKPGLDFCTPDDFFVQAGCWYYESGKKLATHEHKEFPRQALKTQEVTYIKRGRLKASIYNGDRQLVRELELVAGDFAVFAHGGHGYEILEDGTQVLEVKNGPFVGVEQDKELFEGPSA